MLTRIIRSSGNTHLAVHVHSAAAQAACISEWLHFESCNSATNLHQNQFARDLHTFSCQEDCFDRTSAVHPCCCADAHIHTTTDFIVNETL